MLDVRPVFPVSTGSTDLAGNTTGKSYAKHITLNTSSPETEDLWFRIFGNIARRPC